MEFLLEPSLWVSLVTLVILEIVLGIDNLVFIAILADKLPPALRDRARYIGLSLALLMRIGMLAAISWLITLTEPILTVMGLEFSGKDLILLGGGLFLTFKATIELHERLEGAAHQEGGSKGSASFWLVIAQIVVLDAVFSIDSVITAVGMVDQLGVMIAAVVIAMVVMVVASKPLTRFVSAHPTVVILCLSFLLMIGFILIADGFGLHIPKGYLYAAIGFSVLIEAFNQLSRRNTLMNEARQPFRDRTADAILRLMGGGAAGTLPAGTPGATPSPEAALAFGREERQMISGVLTLAERSVKRVMTPRSDISWLDSSAEAATIRQQVLDSPHSLFPVCRGSLDALIGVVRAKEALLVLGEQSNLEELARRQPALLVPDHVENIAILQKLREAKGNLLIIVDEYGSVQGLVTPHDILEAIAGDFPDADETPDILREGESWLVKGATDLYQLEAAIDGLHIEDAGESVVSVGGLISARLGELPATGDAVEVGPFLFTVVKTDRHRVDLVRISPAPAAATHPAD
jgi:CBS domain containing-hemolysin-like protein